MVSDRENELEAQFRRELYADGVFVKDPKMLELYRQARMMGGIDANILINGKSGTGKDHLAKYIHKKSARHNKAFIHLNCSTLPDELFESEFFGYEPGSFTGALSAGKPGLAELANGGTLYLDEISELSPPNQVKLLHFLENRTTTRIGGRRSRSIDAHVIAATNNRLEERIQSGRFRPDLYYRIRTIEVNIPPLRERPEDILLLVEHFEQERGDPHQFTPEAMEYLLDQPWAGNVRELLNFLEKLNVLEDRGTITLEMLTDGRYRFFRGLPDRRPEPAPGSVARPLREAVAEFEREYILRAIEETGTLTEAAHRLGVDLATLNRKKRLYGIYKRGKEEPSVHSGERTAGR